jgi:hypothetical protein
VKGRAFVVSAAIGGLVLAGYSRQGSTATGAVEPQSLAAIPVGGSYTPASWASAFLGVIGEPDTSCNQAAVEAWAAAEGGAWGGDGATANPLNTTQPESGDWSINPVGVKAYPSWQEGLQANATAITNGLYGGVLAALRAGNNAQAVADAVSASPWGTSSFEVSC